jgi:hypothetical protein
VLCRCDAVRTSSVAASAVESRGEVKDTDQIEVTVRGRAYMRWRSGLGRREGLKPPTAIRRSSNSGLKEVGCGR